MSDTTASTKARSTRSRNLVIAILVAAIGLVIFYRNEAGDLPHALQDWGEWFELLAVGPGTAMLVYLLLERARQRETSLERELALSHQEHLLHLGRTAAGIAHEIRNPLHNMQLLVEELVREGSPTAVAIGERLVANMARIDRAIALVYQQASPDMAEAMEPVDLRQVVAHALQDLIPGGQPTLGVDGQQPAMALAHPDALELIVTNLIGNALRHRSDHQLPQIDILRHQRHWQLRISNAGDLHRRGRAGGLGIGLHLCRLLARRMQAPLRLEQRGGMVVAELTLSATGD